MLFFVELQVGYWDVVGQCVDVGDLGVQCWVVVQCQVIFGGEGQVGVEGYVGDVWLFVLGQLVMFGQVLVDQVQYFQVLLVGLFVIQWQVEVSDQLGVGWVVLYFVG